MKLINALIEYRDKHELSDGDIARLIKVKQSNYSLIKNGKRPITLKFLQQVSRGIPELQGKCINHLLGDQ